MPAADPTRDAALEVILERYAIDSNAIARKLRRTKLGPKYTELARQQMHVRDEAIAAIRAACRPTRTAKRGAR